jgi:hypothetical protein
MLLVHLPMTLLSLAGVRKGKLVPTLMALGAKRP